jgi:hypothetical protein
MEVLQTKFFQEVHVNLIFFLYRLVFLSEFLNLIFDKVLLN